MTKATIGKGLAFAAVGGLLAAACGGDEKQTNSSTGAGPGPAGTGDPNAGKDCCKGKNTCKGKGGCKTDKNACSGQNTCKGHPGCNAHCKEGAPKPAST